MAYGTMKPSGAILYFDDAKIALYVVPKAACTSIKRLFGNLYLKRGDLDLSKRSPKGRYKFVVNRLSAGEYPEGYFRIAICRNPWDRIVSTYLDKVVENKLGQRLTDHGFHKGMSFGEFVQLVSEIPDVESDKHIKSQHLTLFRDGTPDFLARVETLNEDWKAIQELFLKRGGKAVPPLGKLNSTSTEKPKLTTAMKTLVAIRYAKDIELLGY